MMQRIACHFFMHALTSRLSRIICVMEKLGKTGRAH